MRMDTSITTGDAVLDKTAIAKQWPDREGVVVKVDDIYSHNLTVRYTSGVERVKWITNLCKKPGFGRWYFTYVSFDTMENSVAMAQCEERVGLEAKTEAEAVAEARALWATLSARQYRGWDKKTYPQQPRVFYEVAWPDPDLQLPPPSEEFPGEEEMPGESRKRAVGL